MLATTLAATPSSLDSTALSRRLAQLAGDERSVQVHFLLHLEEFDRRRAWAENGYGSLWDWCLRVLHLREGAAGRRIAAMRVLRRFPALAGALHDGRLCLSTVALLGPVMTEENLDEIVDRAAFMTRAQVERLIASIAPRTPPREGIRRNATPRPSPAHGEIPTRSQGESAVWPEQTGAAMPERAGTARMVGSAGTPFEEVASPVGGPDVGAAVADPAPVMTAQPRSRPPASRPSVAPVDANTYSLRVTVDEAFKADLDALKDLLAHKVPNGDLFAVLREAVHCGLEKHGKRKGAVAPHRTVPPARPGQASEAPLPSRFASADPGAASRPSPARGHRPTIRAEVRREVWRRDVGRCAWRAPDGRACGSTWRLEIDHVVPAALGGASTVDNLRLTCRAHNALHAERTFGAEFMDRVQGAPPLSTPQLFDDDASPSESTGGGR